MYMSYMKRNDNLRYIVDDKGNRHYTGDERFNPSKTNFHNLKGGNGIFDWILDSQEEYKWRESERYKRLCKRLYKEGLKRIEELKQLDRELSEEELLKFAEHCYEVGALTEEEYNYRKDNIKEYTIERREYEMRASQYKSIEYKLEVYNNIFGNGFDNFINITKKEGNVINGCEVISYDLIFYDENDFDRTFFVN